MGQKLEKQNNKTEIESLIDDEMEVYSLIEENIVKQYELERSVCKDVRIEIKSDYLIDKLVNIDAQSDDYVIQSIEGKIK